MARIPAWVNDLESYRRWARSAEFPERGRYAYLDGEMWVDPSMEQVFSHNQVKGELAFTIMAVNKNRTLGRFFPDRISLSHPGAGLSADPDGVFALRETFRSGRLRLIEGIEEGFVELEGTPDMALEIVSTGSVRKDTVVLRDLYWRADIPECWLVDARGRSPRFDILRHTPKGYVAARRQGGWLHSRVFGEDFRLTRGTDPLGQPLFALLVRSAIGGG
jgi:Uma2 family endonuclease